MKNKKAYDNLVYAVLGTCFIGITLITAQACKSREEVPETQKQNMKRIYNKDIYEVEFDGVKYIVLEKHNGIGICRK